VAFCPHCGAPQIRVSPPLESSGAIAADAASATILSEPGASETSPPASGAEPFPSELAGSPPVQPATLDWRQGLRASALAGLLLALALFFMSMIVAIFVLGLHLGQAPMGLLLLLVSGGCIFAAGALAVRFYRRRRPEASVSGGTGARLGFVSGLLGFLFYSLPNALRLALFHSGSAIRDTMQKAIEQAAAQSPDPRAQEMLRNLMSPGALAAIFTVLVAFFFVFFLVLSCLGGAVGASLWGKKQPL
jgi:hypothetical protein